ncbi:hypothetical protein Tco_0753865 [Tanacetum coccineum]
MSSMSEDIQCAGSDTRPPMLDRTDFESWQQRIRLYCLGKDNRENIMKSINEGPFHMGTVSDVIAGGTEGAVQQGPVRARVLNDLSAEEKERYKADIRATNILLQGIPKDIYSLINHYTDAKDIWENVKMILEGNKLRFKTAELLFKMRPWKIQCEPIKENHFRENKKIFARGNVVAGNVGGSKNGLQDLDSFKDKIATNASHENGAGLDEEQSNCFLQREHIINFEEDVDNSPENDLALNMDHIFEADECDAFDSDVDEGPTTQTMFMTNLTSKDRIYDEAGTSYDSNTPFEGVQSRLANKPDMIINDSVTSELARYKELVGEYEKQAKKKAETLAPKLISALTVYPPNTPVKLVPRILPTKSQVKINLYVLTQLFTEFDKTCKKRITPTGVTEGERGFEQTKRCYLTEVIPFFKTLKEHFVGVQTALFKEVKEMEEIFDQMNNEVDKNTVDKQCAEIEKKNLLIENENLIVNCLSTQLLYDVEKSRCLDLEADMSKVHDESKLISKLEREYLNLQLKYQHLQESFDNKNSQASQEAPDFNSFFKIKNLEHQIQEKDNVIRNLKVLVANVNDRSCEPYNAKDVTALIEQNDCDRVELEKVKQHYKELYDSIKITRAHTSEKTSTMLNEIESLKAQLRSKEPCFTSDYVKPKVLAPGMYAIDVKPIPHPLKNNRSAHLNYISHLKESVETVREIVEEARVVKPLDNLLNYACQYTKLSQELLECVIGTCPKSFNERDNKAPSTPITRKKQVTFSDKPGTSSSNTQKP